MDFDQTWYIFKSRQTSVLSTQHFYDQKRPITLDGQKTNSSNSIDNQTTPFIIISKRFKKIGRQGNGVV
jgi:hypothetical protein